MFRNISVKHTSLSYSICIRFRVLGGATGTVVGSSVDSSELSAVEMSSSSDDTPDRDST